MARLLGTSKLYAVLFGVLLVSLFAVGMPALAQEGRQVTYGELIDGRITAQEFRQIYYFEARRGDVVSVVMQATGGSLDPLLVLVDNTGEMLAISDDSDGGYGAVIETLQIPEDNYYFIVASRYGQGLGSTEGTFTVALQRVGVLSMEGVYLAYGDSVVGAVDDSNPVLRYVFEAQRGDILNLEMRRISGNLDSHLAVENEKGEVLASNDDLGDSLDAAIEGLLILEPGFHTVLASRFGAEAGDSQGSFVLTLDTAPTSGLGITPDSALLLRYGDTASGELDRDTPFRYYTFGAGRGDIVTISMDRTSGNLDPYLAVSNAQGIQLAEDDDSGPSNNALIQSFIIPESGTYIVQAARFDREAGVTAGGYTVRLEGITGEAPVVEPGILTVLYGATVTGTVSDDEYLETYAFLGNAGDVVTIDMAASGGDLDPYLLLFTSASVQLAEDDDSGPGKNARIGPFTLPANDIYYIVATRYEYESGSTHGPYNLSLARQQP